MGRHIELWCMTSLWIDRTSLLAGDLSAREVRQKTRGGDLHRLRPGRYVNASWWADANAVEQHRVRALELGTWLAGRAAISHESAAILHGIQMPALHLPKVHATWPGSPGRGATTNVIPHRSQLRDLDLVLADGVLVTSVARTVFDIARSAPWTIAVAAVDSALHLALCTAEELAEVLEAARRTPGAFRAARIFEFADEHSESVGESICRLRFAQVGLPVPKLQTVIPLLNHADARVDFDFEEYDTVGEFDGKIKFGRLLRPGEEPGEKVFAEKVREDLVRDTGRQMVRFTWPDLSLLPVVRARCDGAFRRAGFPDWQPQPKRFLTIRPAG